MRKSIFMVLLVLTFALSSCDLLQNNNNTTDVVCKSDEKLVGDTCVPNEVDPVVCEVGQIEQNGECVDETAYNDRNLVPDECSTVNNIGEWQPVWCDEFDYTGLPDVLKWSYDVGGSGWGNNELQYYTDHDLDNAHVENGYLTISLLKEHFDTKEYTSARLVSRNQGDWLYGKIQISAKLPTGLGTWPAIWMLPTDWEYGGWPISGEIDIMEHVGYDQDVVHGTIHTGAYNHSIDTQLGQSIDVAGASTDFHLYEIEWEPNVIRFYVDGYEYYKVEYNNQDIATKEDFMSWPFDERFHLILNIAFGGNWGGARGIDDSNLPQEMVVDYVRVFQKDYAGLDQAAPASVTNLELLKSTSNSMAIAWDAAIDDVMVDYYNIYVDSALVGTNEHNAFNVTSLTPDTAYEVSIVAVDFAGNTSEPTTLSFSTSAPASILNRVEAENFTQMSGIDTENTEDTGGGLNVGWIDSGDFLTYTLVVPEDGTYHLDVRHSGENNGSFSFYQESTLLTSVSLTATGDWQSWTTTSSSSFNLTAGTYTFKVYCATNGYNLNYYEFVKE